MCGPIRLRDQIQNTAFDGGASKGLRKGRKPWNEPFRQLIVALYCNILVDLENEEQTNEWLVDDDISDTSDIAEALGMTDYNREISTEDDDDERRQRLLAFLTDMDII